MNRGGRRRGGRTSRGNVAYLECDQLRRRRYSEEPARRRTANRSSGREAPRRLAFGSDGAPLTGQRVRRSCCCSTFGSDGCAPIDSRSDGTTQAGLRARSPGTDRPSLDDARRLALGPRPAARCPVVWLEGATSPCLRVGRPAPEGLLPAAHAERLSGRAVERRPITWSEDARWLAFGPACTALAGLLFQTRRVAWPSGREATRRRSSWSMGLPQPGLRAGTQVPADRSADGTGHAAFGS